MDKKLVATAVAGKMALSVHYVNAAGLGKADSGSKFTDSPQLVLDEVGAPYDILTPPGSTALGNLQEGVIYTNLAAHQRIDFVISGINNASSLNIYLSYSKGKDKADSWASFSEGQGQLELDPESLQVVAAMVISPAERSGPGVFETPATPLGEVKRNHEEITIPVRFSDLTEFEDGETIYFQAIAIPVGTEGEFLWEQAQASEVDTFVINRTDSVNSSYTSIASVGSTSSAASIFGKGN